MAKSDKGESKAERVARERAESDAALLRQEHDVLLEQCGVGVLILDAAGVIERANSHAALIFGVPALVGKTLTRAKLPKELSVLWKSARKECAMQSDEFRLSGGPSVSVSVSPVGINDDDAPPARFVVVVQDRSELRRVEKIRRDFVANVSHEMRTPLASIRAMAETLQDGALSDVNVADRFLGTIVGEAERLTRISEDLLILSDAESRIPETAPVPLSVLIVEVVSRFAAQAKKADLTLKTDLPPGLFVTANYDQIEQVLVNLIDNALKYTPGGGRVTVRAARENEWAKVAVTDTGIGIMRKHLPRLFERFYRVDKARSRQSGGTGLGLSIVKHIAEANGGAVTVSSDYHKGSTFTVTLPAADAPAA